MSEHDRNNNDGQNGASYAVGYRRPPLHTRFKSGQSGNPSGRPKGAQNFKSLFDKILNEQIALQDGSQSKNITKAEAIMRRLVIGALKGDSRSLGTLFRLAEQTGHFDQDREPLTAITRIIVNRFGETGEEAEAKAAQIPGNSHFNRE